MRIKLFSLLALVFISTSLFAQVETTSKEAVVTEVVEKVVKTTEAKVVETAVVEEVKKEELSDWSKALTDRPLTKWLFGLSIFLMLGVLLAAIKIYRTSKEN